MCQAFSCIVDSTAKVTWKFAMNSHTELAKLGGYEDSTSDPSLMTFARIEITPDNYDYLDPDYWSLRVDEKSTPDWFGIKHKEACFAAHKKWLIKFNKLLIRKPIVNPFTIKSPKVTEKHIKLLKQWSSVRELVRSVAGVYSSVSESVGDSGGGSAWDSIRGNSPQTGASVYNSVIRSVGVSVRISARGYINNSIWDSIGAYTSGFFNIPSWKHVKHPKGKNPYMPLIKLWESGLVPSFDGINWRLHGGNKAKVLRVISAKKLRASK
jgi:hypothetical protein